MCHPSHVAKATIQILEKTKSNATISYMKAICWVSEWKLNFSKLRLSWFLCKWLNHSAEFLQQAMTNVLSLQYKRGHQRRWCLVCHHPSESLLWPTLINIAKLIEFAQIHKKPPKACRHHCFHSKTLHRRDHSHSESFSDPTRHCPGLAIAFGPMLISNQRAEKLHWLMGVFR